MLCISSSQRQDTDYKFWSLCEGPTCVLPHAHTQPVSFLAIAWDASPFLCKTFHWVAELVPPRRQETLYRENCEPAGVTAKVGRESRNACCTCKEKRERWVAGNICSSACKVRSRGRRHSVPRVHPKSFWTKDRQVLLWFSTLLVTLSELAPRIR